MNGVKADSPRENGAAKLEEPDTTTEVSRTLSHPYYQINVLISFFTTTNHHIIFKLGCHVIRSCIQCLS